MNLTESQAKTKWCPFSRTAAFTDRGQLMAVTTNRDPRSDVQSSCNCIASECMAWKWEIKDNELKKTQNKYEGIMVIMVPPEGEGWINHDKERGLFTSNETLWRREIKTDKGYCGLMK